MAETVADSTDLGPHVKKASSGDSIHHNLGLIGGLLDDILDLYYDREVPEDPLLPLGWVLWVVPGRGGLAPQVEFKCLLLGCLSHLNSGYWGNGS